VHSAGLHRLWCAHEPPFGSTATELTPRTTAHHGTCDYHRVHHARSVCGCYPKRRGDSEPHDRTGTQLQPRPFLSPSAPHCSLDVAYSISTWYSLSPSSTTTLHPHVATSIHPPLTFDSDAGGLSLIDLSRAPGTTRHYTGLDAGCGNRGLDILRHHHFEYRGRHASLERGTVMVRVSCVRVRKIVHIR
jgi:hypothetical protein